MQTETKTREIKGIEMVDGICCWMCISLNRSVDGRWIEDEIGLAGCVSLSRQIDGWLMG